MSPRSAISCVALLALACATAALAAPPSRVEITYELTAKGMTIAELRETLEHDGRRYTIRSELRGKGLFALSARGNRNRVSSGTVAANGLKPAEFRDQFGDRSQGASFDWGRRVVLLDENGEKKTEPMNGPAYDRLSFHYTFAFSAPRADVSATISDGRANYLYVYKLAGRETIKTPIGDIEALKLVKQKDPGDDRGSELWLDIKRGYLPVRALAIEKDGSQIDQVVTRIDEKTK